MEKPINLHEYVTLPVLAYDQMSNLFDIRQAVFAIQADDRRGATSYYALRRMHSSFNFQFFRRHSIGELDQTAEILKKT